MEIREIKSREELENFLKRIKPHTFLASWGWGEFEEMSGRKSWRLGAYESGSLIASATVSKTVARRGTFLVWHHGPVVDPLFLNKTEEIVKALRDESVRIAKEEKCDFIRVSTTLSNTPDNQQIFKSLGFREAPIHLHSELGWVLELEFSAREIHVGGAPADVKKSEEELLQAMRKNTRYAIRKAEKDGIEIVSSSDMADFEKFWSIYMDTVTRQKFVPYSEKYLRNEFEIFMKSGQALLWFGKYQGEYIATAFVVYTSNSGFYHHGASTHKFPAVSASELLQWAAIKEAKKRGCDQYNFWGVVPETAEKHPWYGLSRFKRGFGGHEEEYLHAKDYVLKPKYWLTYCLERYRKWKRGV